MTDSLLQLSLEQALNQIPTDVTMAVALSGGPDSSALAVCADQWATQHNRPLWLFHVHHGLHVQADQWTATVRQLAHLLNRPLAVKWVDVNLASGHGVEGAARQARYQAIKAMAAEQGVDTILLAHHQQDQAETVLMRLLRGAGVTGLAAMARVKREQGLYWVRPWLCLPRQALLDDLAAFTERTGWVPVNDPSNEDGKLARGMLRSKLIPAIETHWPAWQQTLVRHAQQAAQAQRLLARYGEQLLSTLAIAPSLDPISGGTDNKPAMAPSDSPVSPPTVLSLARWRALDPDEQSLTMRVWLSAAGVQMPTEGRLAELLKQLRNVHALGHDRDLRWAQRDCVITCIRGQLHLHVKISDREGGRQDDPISS